mmetsp:Transcript_25028/g.48899  ORF Transcript_25028/g.48899 Transcript_25028/m.48899 type:complete len:206 (-) Transcript_25028:294-911(-)
MEEYRRLAQEKHKRFRAEQQRNVEDEGEDSSNQAGPHHVEPPEEVKDPFVALAEKYSNASERVNVNLLVPQKGTTRLRISIDAKIEEIRAAFQPLTVAMIYKGKRLSDDSTLRECGVSDEDVIHCWKTTTSKIPIEEETPALMDNIDPMYVLCALVLAVLAVLWGLLVTAGKRYFTPFSTLLLFALTGGAGILMREVFIPSGNFV